MQVLRLLIFASVLDRFIQIRNECINRLQYVVDTDKWRRSAIGDGFKTAPSRTVRVFASGNFCSPQLHVFPCCSNCATLPHAFGNLTPSTKRTGKHFFREQENRKIDKGTRLGWGEGKKKKMIDASKNTFRNFESPKIGKQIERLKRQSKQLNSLVTVNRTSCTN